MRLPPILMAPVLAAILISSSSLSLAPRQAGAAEPKELPPPKELSLKTRDGMTLAATYYASNLGKDAATIILLHGAKGSRHDFSKIAPQLQEAGHAVIAPDLRGHGDSTRPFDRSGELRTADYLGMVEDGGDLETVKTFLLQRNNAGELNVEKLGIVALDAGCVIAINWAALDWSWPMLTTGKQGQDVKALVLISPEWAAKGLRINDALTDPNVRRNLSMMIIAGKSGHKPMQDAKRLHNTLERYHPTPLPDEAVEKQTLWLRTPATSLQGAALMNDKNSKIDQLILRFFEARLSKRAFEWTQRGNVQ
jgi:pimeloyl-ACP methyl ester carboxylesterase